MIYLDVTSACKSPLNTGVKRMQRGLHAWLSRQGDYQPVCWQGALGNYRLLLPRDFQNLQRPAGDVRGLALYDAFATGLITDWTRMRRDRAHQLNWPRDLRAGDVLLVPDFLWDGRAHFFQRPCAPGVRRLGIFHDAIPLRLPGQSPLDAYLCARGIRAMAHFDQVICVSQEAETDLHFYWKKFGEKPVPTRVLPWPIPFAQERPPSSSNFAAKEIFCLARLQSYKNHLGLLDACDFLWREGLEFKLRLIGCKSWPVAVWKILRRIEGLRGEGRDVLWQPHVTEDALHAAYRSSSFTVFPSLREGFGLPVMESLWHGRPVVCGAGGAIGEVAAGGGCETVDLGGRESMAAAVRRLLTDAARYEELFHEARNREFPTWEQYGAQLRDAMAQA
jgi:glycosyltransferase involved in cell wall biosynthesis